MRRAERDLADRVRRLDWPHDAGGVALTPDWDLSVSDSLIDMAVAAAATEQGGVDAFGRSVDVDAAAAYWRGARDDAVLVGERLAAARHATDSARGGEAVALCGEALRLSAAYDEDRAVPDGAAPTPPGRVVDL